MKDRSNHYSSEDSTSDKNEYFCSKMSEKCTLQNKKMIYSLAPMLKYTTAEFRRLLRIISSDIALFTEMISADYIIRNKTFWGRIGKYDSNTIIQIGGSDPNVITSAVERIIHNSEFRQFNLNVGCPSQKVTKGQFGASLMLRVNIVNDIINEVYKRTGVIFSVKCRIGVDEFDSFEFFESFIKSVSENTKCKTFYVHARKCWLDGLSPKENRNIPELKHHYVKDIKKKYPWLEIHLNGGVKSNSDAEGLDGIMIGREVIKNLFVFEELKKTGIIIPYKENKNYKLTQNIKSTDRTNESGIEKNRKEIESKNTSNTQKENDIAVNTSTPIQNLDICKDIKNDFNSTIEDSQIREGIEPQPIPRLFSIMEKYFIDHRGKIKHLDIIPVMNLFRGQKCNKKIKKILNEVACQGDFEANECLLLISEHLKKFGYVLP